MPSVDEHQNSGSLTVLRNIKILWVQKFRGTSKLWNAKFWGASKFWKLNILEKHQNCGMPSFEKYQHSESSKILWNIKILECKVFLGAAKFWEFKKCVYQNSTKGFWTKYFFKTNIGFLIANPVKIKRTSGARYAVKKPFQSISSACISMFT